MPLLKNTRNDALAYSPPLQLSQRRHSNVELLALLHTQADSATCRLNSHATQMQFHSMVLQRHTSTQLTAFAVAGSAGGAHTAVPALLLRMESPPLPDGWAPLAEAGGP